MTLSSLLGGQGSDCPHAHLPGTSQDNVRRGSEPGGHPSPRLRSPPVPCPLAGASETSQVRGALLRLDVELCEEQRRA